MACRTFEVCPAELAWKERVLDLEAYSVVKVLAFPSVTSCLSLSIVCFREVYNTIDLVLVSSLFIFLRLRKRIS